MTVKKQRRSLGSVYFHKPSKRWTYKFTVGGKRKHGQSPCGNLERRIQRRVDTVSGDDETKTDLESLTAAMDGI